MEFFVFMSAVVTVLFFTNWMHDGSAAANTIPSKDAAGVVRLGAPFYEEHYKAELGGPLTNP